MTLLPLKLHVQPHNVFLDVNQKTMEWVPYFKSVTPHLIRKQFLLVPFPSPIVLLCNMAAPN